MATWREFVELLTPLAKRPYFEIEPKIKPLVDALNRHADIRTIASCQGHYYGKSHYVYFQSTVEIAGLIARKLRDISILDKPILMTDWEIYGMFNQDFVLTFLLHSPDYRQRGTSLVQAMWLFGWKRRKLDAELLTLGCIVNQALLLEVRHCDEPKVAKSNESDTK